MLPESQTVNEAATRNESYRSYPGRFRRRETAVTTSGEKSAEAIVLVNKARKDRTNTSFK